MAVARVGSLGLRLWRLGLGVEAALEFSEDDAEQRVAPRCLSEGPAIASHCWQLPAGGVEVIGQRDEGPGDHVLDECDGRPAELGRNRKGRDEIGVRGAEQGAVVHVEGEAERIPAFAAGDCLAEQLDVVAAAAEHELVDWLLQRPDSRRDCAADGASERAGRIDSCAQDRNCNGRPSNGYANVR